MHELRPVCPWKNTHPRKFYTPLVPMPSWRFSEHVISMTAHGYFASVGSDLSFVSPTPSCPEPFAPKPYTFNTLHTKKKLERQHTITSPFWSPFKKKKNDINVQHTFPSSVRTSEM